MKRADLEHILRASKGTTGETEFIVVGSQAILGKHPDARRLARRGGFQPHSGCRRSARLPASASCHNGIREVRAPGVLPGAWFGATRCGRIKRAVSNRPSLRALPAGWESRLVKVENENTNGAIRWCLDPHDIAFSKLAARREEDLAYVAALIRHKLVRPSEVEALIATADGALRGRLSEAWAICRVRAAEERAD